MCEGGACFKIIVREMSAFTFVRFSKWKLLQGNAYERW
jgi:hypothetical protein